MSTIGVSTTKTTKPSVSREFTNMNATNREIHNFKNRAAAAATTKASNEQKIRFDQQTIKQKLQQQNDKFHSNMGIF